MQYQLLKNGDRYKNPETGEFVEADVAKDLFEKARSLSATTSGAFSVVKNGGLGDRPIIGIAQAGVFRLSASV